MIDEEKPYFRGSVLPLPTPVPEITARDRFKSSLGHLIAGCAMRYYDFVASWRNKHELRKERDKWRR